MFNKTPSPLHDFWLSTTGTHAYGKRVPTFRTTRYEIMYNSATAIPNDKTSFSRKCFKMTLLFGAFLSFLPPSIFLAFLFNMAYVRQTTFSGTYRVNCLNRSAHYFLLLPIYFVYRPSLLSLCAFHAFTNLLFYCLSWPDLCMIFTFLLCFQTPNVFMFSQGLRRRILIWRSCSRSLVIDRS